MLSPTLPNGREVASDLDDGGGPSETPQPRDVAATVDPTELALAAALEGVTRALDGARAAEEWKTVGELGARLGEIARQLEARRVARERERDPKPDNVLTFPKAGTS